MKTRTLPLLALLALGATPFVSGCHNEPDPKVPLEVIAMEPNGAAQLPPGVAAGRSPRLAPGQPLALWIGQKGSGEWYLRTTTMRAKTRFHGRIRAASGELTNFRPTRMDLNDRFRFEGKDVVFDISTQAEEDGFDFAAAKGSCVELDLRINGEKVPEKILIGEKEYKTPSSHFILCP